MVLIKLIDRLPIWLRTILGFVVIVGTVVLLTKPIQWMRSSIAREYPGIGDADWFVFALRLALTGLMIAFGILVARVFFHELRAEGRADKE